MITNKNCLAAPNSIAHAPSCWIHRHQIASQPKNVFSHDVVVLCHMWLCHHSSSSIFSFAIIYLSMICCWCEAAAAVVFIYSYVRIIRFVWISDEHLTQNLCIWLTFLWKLLHIIRYCLYYYLFRIVQLILLLFVIASIIYVDKKFSAHPNEFSWRNNSAVNNQLDDTAQQYCFFII